MATCADEYSSLPHDQRVEKAHCFVTNIEAFKLLGTICPLHPGTHERFAGKKDRSGRFILWKTAEFSDKLAEKMAEAIRPLVSQGGPGPVSVETATKIGVQQLRDSQLRLPSRYAADGGSEKLRRLGDDAVAT